MFSACNKNQTNNKGLATAVCDCEKTSSRDTIIFATDVHVKKETNRNLLIFRCASVLTGTASVSDINGNNEHCEAMYDVQCVSSVDTSLPLSESFQYFTDHLQVQNLFFEDVKEKKEDYFELTLGPDRKIISVSRLNIK